MSQIQFHTQIFQQYMKVYYNYQDKLSYQLHNYKSNLYL